MEKLEKLKKVKNTINYLEIAVVIIGFFVWKDISRVAGIIFLILLAIEIVLGIICKILKSNKRKSEFAENKKED